ncbi:MAG: hypothetical protein ACI4VJ_03750 [Methanosphaera sp.]
MGPEILNLQNYALEFIIIAYFITYCCYIAFLRIPFRPLKYVDNKAKHEGIDIFYRITGKKILLNGRPRAEVMSLITILVMIYLLIINPEVFSKTFIVLGYTSIMLILRSSSLNKKIVENNTPQLNNYDYYVAITDNNLILIIPLVIFYYLHYSYPYQYTLNYTMIFNSSLTLINLILLVIMTIILFPKSTGKMINKITGLDLRKLKDYEKIVIYYTGIYLTMFLVFMKRWY